MENSTKLSLSKIRNVAKTEYVKWICNPRMIILFCMLIYIYDYIIIEMKNASTELSDCCNIFEPFLAIGNSPLLLLIIPIVFITLLGDFPKTDGNTMFYICRTGKKNWLLGQMLFAVWSEITYLITVFVCSVLFSCTFSKVSYKWSDVVTKYTYTFPEKRGSLVANLLTNRLYNNLSPLETMLYTFSMMFLNLLLMSMIMLTGFSLGKRILSIVVNCAIMCLGTALAMTESRIKWLFPTANTTCWMHFDKYLNKQIFSVSYSYMYFLFLIIVLGFIAINAINTYDFSKITDMED